MLKKRFFRAVALITALVMLSACGGSAIVLEKREVKPSTGKSWSVMVYLCGGGADDGVIKRTLDELMSADYSENVNFIVQTGGRNEWNTYGIDADYNQRFLMQNKSMFLSGQTAAADMASSDVLSDFLNWGIKTYPADHYALIINGAGGGAMNGAGLDEKNEDILTTEDVAVSLGATGKQFDIIGFDASFMSSIETAAALSPYARYMVASEDMICPYGFDYSALSRYIINNPDSGAEAVCREICDGYFAKCDKYGMADAATMAVTDLSRVTELSQAFDGMAGMMVFALDGFDTGARMLRRLSYAERSGAQSPCEGYTDMADLKNLAETIQVDMGATAQALINAIDEVVTYSVSGRARPYVKGLGVYFPMSGTADSINRYCAVFPSHNYLTFARKVSVNAQTELGAGEEDYNMSGAYWSYSEYAPNMILTAFENGDGCYELDIDAQMLLVRDICVDVYVHDETGESYKVGTKYDIDGDIETGTMFTAEFPTEVLSINGHNVCASRTEKGFGTDIYSAPVLLNGEKTNIRIVHTYGGDGDSYKIIGAWSGIDAVTGLDKRDFRLLKAGDKITPLFELYGGLDMKEGEPFRIGVTGASVKPAQIEGAAAYRYRVTDMYGNEHESDMYIR